ncbi:hypothetical protein NIES593_14770 [Hydrococcus rivularis NIES-593]|uniref:Uncharacterized protein n=1 Tax=Hydrococcus rivularis NIES-593 TaxID=1921803 RepID=A0A1U7HDS6_9CYAN|nr:hypothetical protein [Hydrococcus rivularis]OKH21695.1 hypothetical protein NIES593_14770 [Hydrococcus rivularis NIES-593]
MLTSRKKTVDAPKRLPILSEEERMEQERMRDVLVLLEHLVEREETTLKLIIDRLYDVGSVNLINKKFPNRPRQRRMMKSIARIFKPVAKIYALRWVKKNCPRLVTNWLQTKVRF